MKIIKAYIRPDNLFLPTYLNSIFIIFTTYVIPLLFPKLYVILQTAGTGILAIYYLEEELCRNVWGYASIYYSQISMA